jgi:hypothetical protein
VSKFFCILSGIIAIFAGVSLASVNAVSQNSLVSAIANGMGWYFISKGMYMIASLYLVGESKKTVSDIV